MLASRCTEKTKSLFLVLVALLFVFQFNALFIHELGLLYQGYELAYDPPGTGHETPAETRVLTAPENGEYYNVATCCTHFLLQILSSFTGVALVSLLLGNRFIERVSWVINRRVSSKNFCWFQIPRAPPFLVIDRF